LRAEYRRIGVSDAEVSAILRRRLELYMEKHPQLRGEPDLLTQDVTHAFSCEIALDALAGLADGAGTAAYLERLERLERERGWHLPGWSPGSDA
jgi:hypothetical protein